MEQDNKPLRAVFPTPWGNLIVGVAGGYVRICDWESSKRLERHLRPFEELKRSEGDQELLDRTLDELGRYLRGELRQFTVPHKAWGSPFQHKVWDAVSAIPYGEITYYGDLAKGQGMPLSVRSAASAVAENPLSLIVPCHRVIPCTRICGNYAGGADAKAALLRMEGFILPTREEMYRSVVGR